MFLYGSIRGTSLEASREVFVFPPLSICDTESNLLGKHSLTFFSRDDGLNNRGEMKMEVAK
jgi:hypothetical protein